MLFTGWMLNYHIAKSRSEREENRRGFCWCHVVMLFLNRHGGGNMSLTGVTRSSASCIKHVE